MFFTLFPHRDTESLRERRFIFLQNPEAPRERPQTVLERLTDEHANEADIEKAVAELPEESDVYRAVVLEGQKLDSKQRQIVGSNLKRLSECIELKAKTQADQVKVLAKVERMRSALSAPPETRPTEPAAPAETAPPPEAATNVPTASAPAQPEQGLWARSWEQAGKYWNEASPTVKAAGAGVGVAVLAYGVYRFGRWLWGGTKEVAEKTKEGMGWFGKSLLIGGSLAIAGAAGYLGFKALEKRMKEMVGDIKDAAKEKVLAAKRMAEEQLTRVEEALQRGGDRAREHVDELKEEKRKLTEKIAEYDRALQERRAEPAQPASASPNEEPVNRPQGEQVREEAEDLMKAAGTRLLARGLLAIYPAAPEFGTVHESQVNDFIHANQGRPLRDLFACVHADPALAEATANDVTILHGSVTVLAEDRERREAAAKYVILLCWNKRQSLLASREDLKPEDVDAMTMLDFVQAFAQGAEAVAGIIETVVAAEGDPRKLRELINPEQLYLASGAEGELALLIGESRERLGLSAQALQNIRPLDVMKFALRQGGVTARGFGKTHQSPGEGPDAGPTAMLASICSAMEDETPRFMLPFFHKIFPDQTWSASKTENLEHVRTILMDRMPLSQAVRLYLYQRMMQRGNPVSILLMQAEIFKYVALQDERLLREAHAQMILAMGETSLQAMAAEGEWPDLPSEVMENGQRMLGFLTEKGAKTALAAAVLVPREGLAWLKSAYVRYPLVATPVALVSAYLVKVYSDLGVRPADVIFRADQMKAGLAAPPLPARVLKATILRPWFASAADARNAKQLLSDLDAKIAQLIDLDAPLGNALYDRFVRTFRGLDSKRAWQMFADEIAAHRAALPKGHPGIALCDEILSKARSIATNSGVRKAVRLASRPRINVLLTDKLAAGANVVRDAAGATVGRWGRHWMNEWRTASTGARAAYVAGVGVHALALYGDYVEIGEIEKQRDSAVQHAGSVVDRLRQDLERDRTHFERVSYGVYRHKMSGVEISLRGLQRQIDTHVGGVFDERELAQKLRTVNTGAGLAATILVGAKAFTGLAGLVIAGVEITIRTGINAWEQSKMRTFLNDAPPWLLAVLGAQETTGEGEYDWLEKASSWMLSDLWPSSSESAMDGNKDKPELRHRMLYSIFIRELMQHAPEVLNESLGGMWSPEILDRFYKQDFTQLVLPMFSANLFAITRDGNLSLQAALKGEMGVNATGLTATKVTLMDIRDAMRRSAVYYLQHIREKRYVEYRSLLSTIPTTHQNYAAIRQLTLALGGVKVFGQRLDAVPPEMFERYKGTTRAEVVLRTLIEQLDQAPGETRIEKIRQNAQLFVVSPSSVAGLPAAIDFNNCEQLLSFMDDPAIQINLKRFTTQTLGEELAQKRPRWNDWSVSPLTHLPTAVDEMDAIFYSAPFGAANLIAESLGEPPIHKNTSVLDLFGRSQDAASYDAARTYITEGLDRLCAHRSAKDGSLRRSPSYDELYGENGPVVFTRGNNHSNRALARFIKHPGIETAGYGIDHLQAVLLEGQDIGGGHSGVLATYIFGDLESGKVSILQRGAGTFMLSRMPKPGFIDGLDRPLTLQEFLARPGAETLLQEAKNALTERKTKAAEEARQRAQHRREEEQAAGDTWQKDSPQRAEKIAAQRRLRAGAWERARSDGIIGFVPGEYTEDAKAHQLTLAPGSFRGRFGATDVEIDDVSTADAVFSANPEIEPTPFRFRAQRGDKSWNFHVTMDALRAEPTPDFTREDQQLTRDVLVTPMNLAGHPRAGNQQFVEQVRREELNRVLRMAQYRGGNGWTGREYLSHLHQELWPVYRDAQDKSVFLNTLLNNLLEERTVTGGAFNSTYRRILKNMKHEW